MSCFANERDEANPMFWLNVRARKIGKAFPFLTTPFGHAGKAYFLWSGLLSLFGKIVGRSGSFSFLSRF